MELYMRDLDKRLEGKEEGRKEERVDYRRKLVYQNLNAGLTLQQVADFLSLSIDEVKQIYIEAKKEYEGSKVAV